MPKIRLDHFVMHVGDWEVCSRFYKDVLGAELIPYGIGCMFRFGDVQINTHGPDQIGEPRAAKPVMPGNSDFCFEWDGDCESAADHLKSHGVEIELGPVERFGSKGGGTSLYFRDPDGSLLEFICYPRQEDGAARR